MSMKSPPRPGRGLKDDIDALGWTIAETAGALGVTRRQLYNVINGKSGIAPEMAVRLEKGVGGTAAARHGPCRPPSTSPRSASARRTSR